MKGEFSFRDHRGTRRGWIILGIALVALLIWLFALSRLHVNASWSDAAWGYWLPPLPGEPVLGDEVLFRPPESAGSPVPYLKSIRGLPGDRVSVDPDRTVRINGIAVGKAKTHARNGRPLDAIQNGVIPPKHFFVFADHPDSHDSRYAEIGLIAREDLLGRAVTLPDIPWLGLEGPWVGPDAVRVGSEAALEAVSEAVMEPDPNPATAPSPDIEARP